MMLPAKRRKVTVIASQDGIARAEKQLSLLFESRFAFAEAQLMGRSTVDKFFNQQPIQPSSFKRICEGLRIANWESLVEQGVKELATDKFFTRHAVGFIQAVPQQITVVDGQNGKVRITVTTQVEG